MSEQTVTFEPNNIVRVRLKSFLGPNNVRPYDTLPDTLESLRRDGYTVCLIAVAGFTCLSGYPGDSEYPWWDGTGTMEYRTAGDALKGKNGRAINQE
jgi:hypothetical protein